MTNSGKQSVEFTKKLLSHSTEIPGLIWFDLPIDGDTRGWFKENWQRKKQIAAGLPDFSPVQNNISFNAERGVTRGIHAEPWDKYVSVASGRIFGAWVDLREGDTFGTTFTLEIDASKAIYIPRGVGNSFQALENNTAYSYLVNDHWSTDDEAYAFVNLGCSKLSINWPIPLDQAILSDKDRQHPHLTEVAPVKSRKILITGANGQLGKALRSEFPDAEFVDKSIFDITNTNTWADRNWRQYSTIINAAAYTNVDTAETADGRQAAWKVNATAVGNLAQLAIENNLTLVHVSSDYVFDGSSELHTENEDFTPLSVYGQTKASGDIAAATVPRHYIIRTAWVIGDGDNFVKTMQKLAIKNKKPSVVDDQIGRPTFTKDLAKGIKHLIESQSPYGTYNITNSGEPASWAEIAKQVYDITGYNGRDVTSVSTSEYYMDKTGIAPRPLQSTLKLDKIEATGFAPRKWDTALREYLSNSES